MGNSGGKMQSEEERRRYIRAMDAAMNQRFGRTSKHKLKIVIRGEKECGKTTLTRLLSGGLFDAKYVASKPDSAEELSVPWASGPGEDVLLTMVAVSESDRRTGEEAGANSLKIAHDEKDRKAAARRKAVKGAAADRASHYKDCDGVIVMVNPGKEWTFSFAKDVLEEIPEGLEVLLLANFRDQADQWVTPKLQMQQHIATSGRNVHYCECSLANMFGMPSVEAFLRISLFELKVRDLSKQMADREGAIEDAVSKAAKRTKAQDFTTHAAISFSGGAARDPPSTAPLDSAPPGSAGKEGGKKDGGGGDDFYADSDAKGTKEAKDIPGAESPAKDPNRYIPPERPASGGGALKFAMAAPPPASPVIDEAFWGEDGGSGGESDEEERKRKEKKEKKDKKEKKEKKAKKSA